MISRIIVAVEMSLKASLTIVLQYRFLVELEHLVVEDERTFFFAIKALVSYGVALLRKVQADHLLNNLPGSAIKG